MDNYTTNTAGKAPKKSSKKRWFFLGLGLVSTGILSYFCFDYWKKHKGAATGTAKAPEFKAEKPNGSATQRAHAAPKKAAQPGAKAKAKTATANSASDFPLKRGSKGDKVKALQQALIDRYGKKILAKGADGVFGSDVAAALKKLNLPNEIDETTFNVLVQKEAINAKAMATAFYGAIVAKSFTNAIKLLKLLKSPADYKAVSDAFVKVPLLGTRSTLVNGLLNHFTSASQKESIRLALAAIGLKYDGKTWSLSGIDGKPLLITTQPTSVWKDPQHSVNVPLNMVLGSEITRRGNYTLFENDKQYFLVESQHVTTYKNPNS